MFAGVVRAKGYIWIATADACPIIIHTAGRQGELEPDIDNPWFHKLVETHPNGDEELEYKVEEDCNIWRAYDVKKAIEKLKEGKEWSANFGDRSSEFVCIGIKLEKEMLVEALNAALLTDEELSKGRESWKELDDPILDGAKLWDLKDLTAFGEEKRG